MADLTFKVDGDTGGFINAMKRATTTMKDFGLVGGPPILAVKAAVGGVEIALKGVTSAGRGAVGAMNALGNAGTGAWGRFVAGGKVAVAVLNQINGAVELANKVLPALVFPLTMAENADRVKGAFESLKTTWGELAGELGKGVNNALIPVLKAAGVEVGQLKEQARGIGESIGAAIDLTRVSYQMGKLPEILWLGMQRVTLQWGADLLEMFTRLGFQMARIMDAAVSGAFAGLYDLLGMDEKAAARRAGSNSRQAGLKANEEEAVGGMREFLAPVRNKIAELGGQMDALTAPMKERIAAEKEATKIAIASVGIFSGMNKAIQNALGGFAGGGSGGGGGGSGGGSGGSGGGLVDRMETQQDKMAREALGMPAPRLSGGDPMAWQGPPAPTGQAKAPKASGGATGAPNRQAITLARQFGRQGSGSGAQGWQEFLSSGVRTAGLNGGQIGALRRMDPAQLAQTVTNKTNRSGADKAEREAAQRDAKGLAAADAVAKGLPQIAADMAAVKGHLSKIQSR